MNFIKYYIINYISDFTNKDFTSFIINYIKDFVKDFVKRDFINEKL